MAIGMTITIVVAVIIILFLLIGWIVAIYNGLVMLRNNIDKSWSNINVLLKQRHDELPKLIASVKGYMKHEKTVLENVTKARTAFMKAKDIHEKAASSNMMTDALKTLFAVAENYPKLQANENFMQLQGRISSLEGEISDRREFFNDSVNTYNIKIQQFPDMIIAGMGKFTKKELFRVNAEDVKDVKVEF